MIWLEAIYALQQQQLRVHYYMYCVLGCEVDLKLNTQFAADLFIVVVVMDGRRALYDRFQMFRTEIIEVFMNKKLSTRFSINFSSTIKSHKTTLPETPSSFSPIN